MWVRHRHRRAKADRRPPEPQPAPEVWRLDDVVAELRQAAFAETIRPCSHGPDCTYGACESKPMTFATPPEGFTPFGTVKFERLGDDPTTVQPIMWNDGIHPARRWP